jgi:hypothetical protein
MKNRLVLLLLVLVLLNSCDTTQTDNNKGEIQKIDSLAFDTLRLYRDTLNWAFIEKIQPEKKTRLPVEAGQEIHFCVQRGADASGRVRINIDYKGAGRNFTVLDVEVTPGGQISFNFTTPGDGELVITIKQREFLGWSNQNLVESKQHLSCCPPSGTAMQKRMLMNRITIKTTDETTKTTTVSVEQ